MTVPARPAEKRARRFDPTSWGGALIVMVAFAGVLYLVEFIDQAGNAYLTWITGGQVYLSASPIADTIQLSKTGDIACSSRSASS